VSVKVVCASIPASWYRLLFLPFTLSDEISDSLKKLCDVDGVPENICMIHGFLLVCVFLLTAKGCICYL
jgi:hypothetical protein